MGSATTINPTGEGSSPRVVAGRVLGAERLPSGCAEPPGIGAGFHQRLDDGIT